MYIPPTGGGGVAVVLSVVVAVPGSEVPTGVVCLNSSFIIVSQYYSICLYMFMRNVCICVYVCTNVPSFGSVWLYSSITVLLPDLPAELTASTVMLVYTLFLSSPVKL